MYFYSQHWLEQGDGFSMQELLDIVDREGISLRYDDLSRLPENINGLYMYERRIGPLIVLDRELDRYRRLHRCVLAEEIGHYYTSPRTNLLLSYSSYALQVLEGQSERRAMQWGTDFLIPDAELIKALSEGCRSCFELAEYFDVTESFMYHKLGFLKMCFRRTGLKIRGRDLFDMELQPCHINL
ncbi:hypothetical protein CEB3_c18020 [Peptococcaceae bacterium CEB3]|nr:hypothetical protein CEB3_c18020 [Peptococcaceae bacterium CEB3]